MIGLTGCEPHANGIRGFLGIRESWLTALALALALMAGLPGPCRAQPSPHSDPSGNLGTSSSMTLNQERASTTVEHHYASPGERARDDLIIVEVKRALADDGVSKGHAVEVDADHGTVILSGVIGSPAAARHAVKVARRVEGVVAVDNRLSWK